MKISISDNKKIFDVQEEFNKEFPYLKVEFFLKPQQYTGESPPNLIINNSKTLGECRMVHNNGEITITSATTVSDLELNFINLYGLKVQVFRKSGKAWLKATLTHGWTLEEQNQQGEALSK